MLSHADARGPQDVFAPLETDRLIVRHFEDGDLDAFVAYRNDPEISRYQSWDSISAPRAQAFIQEQKRLQPGEPGRWFHFALAARNGEQLAGDVGLQVLLADVRQAQVNISLAGEYQGRGLAAEALTAVLDFAFIQMDLHRVVAVTDAQNQPAVALLERLGLRREGHFIKNIWFKGAWADEYLYAVLQAEWLPKRSKW
jgi:RimJ/RimL family protein N-acetyltransferase